jgi:hypothetical protein
MRKNDFIYDNMERMTWYQMHTMIISLK